MNAKKRDEYEGVDLSGLCESTRQAMITHILEGMIPPKEMLDNWRLYDAGKIDRETLLARENARIDAKYGND